MVTIEKEKGVSCTRCMVVFLCAMLLFAAVAVVKSYKTYARDNQLVSSGYVLLQKDLIKHEVQKIVDAIDPLRKKNAEQQLSGLRARVDASAEMIQKVSSAPSGGTVEVLLAQSMSQNVSSLHPVFYFTAAADGEISFFSSRIASIKQGDLEGSGLPEMLKQNAHRPSGFLWLDNQFAAVKKEQAAYYLYMQQLVPEGVFIGAALSRKDVEEKAKEKVLEQTAAVRYGLDDGYLFVFHYDGVYLSHIAQKYIGQNMIHITDPNGVKINREIVRKCRNGGGFVEYVWDRHKTGQLVDKISYVQGYEDWQWAFGTGFYRDALDLEIDSLTKGSREHLRDTLLMLGGLLLLITVAVACYLRFASPRRAA